MDQRAIFKQRKVQSNTILIMRQYLESAKVRQEFNSLLWINDSGFILNNIFMLNFTARKRDGICINKIIGF